MSRESLKAMESIFPELKFTMEIEDDFVNKRLPTLDFDLYVEDQKVIRHGFYEKPINTPFVTMERSALAEQSKISILANDLVRRMSNIGEENREKESIEVVDNYTRKLKTSGYTRVQAKEIIISGLRGFEAKVERAKGGKRPFYRKARDTLRLRIKKKLLEKTSWYRKRKDKEPKNKKEKPRSNRNPVEKTELNQGDIEIKAVMFVPRTKNGELARKLREKEMELGKLTGFRLKIVERAGTSIEKMLHKSNICAGEDCDRDKCLMCESKSRSEEPPQSCYKRNCVYEIVCNLCEKQDPKVRSVYVGESNRSGHERGREHLDDMLSYRESSHMLKHLLQYHQDCEANF